MRESVARRLVPLALAGLVSLGCENSAGNKEPKVTLTTSAPSASVGQGQSTTLSVFVAREHFDKTVTLTVEGAPAGLTAIATPGSVEAATPSSTLLISATPSAEPGPATLTVRAKGDGIPDQTVTVDVTVTVTGTFALTAADQSLTVAQGGGGANTIVVSRGSNNASNVSLAVTGLPSGVTANFSVSPTTSTSSTLTLSATGGAPVGTSTITVTGTATGLPNQTTTFSLSVTAPPATANVSIPFCANGMPSWFAFRNEGYNWQQVTATGNTFNFAATQKLNVAYAFTGGGDTQVNIFYVTRDEFSATTDRDCDGPKSHPGSVAGLSAGQGYDVVMGSALASGTSFSPTFTLSGVADRPLDLVATRGTPSGDFLTPDKMIVRRGLNLTTGTTIPALDFSAPEAFDLAANNLTIQGLQPNDQIELHNTLWTATSTFGTAHSAQLTGGTATLYSAPAAQLIAGDLHELFIDASQSSSSLVTGRSYFEYFSAPADRTISLGPDVATPTLSAVSSSPYSRMRAQITTQPEYNTFADIAYVQQNSSGGDRVIVVGLSAAYLGSTPTTWDITIPDFTGTGGFNNAWMLVPGLTTIYAVETYSGRTVLLFGALPTLGDVVRYSYRAALTISLSVALRAPEAGSRLPRVNQYFRR